MTEQPPPRVPGYVLREVLGRGSDGTVWRGEPQGSPGRVVAVKVVSAPALGGTQRLLREADALARLSHPNVLQLIEVVTDGDEVAVVTPLATGGSLARRIAAGEVIEEAVELADLGARLASALAAAHTAGLVHRDVKPANVLFDREAQPLLADLGVATLRGEPGQLVGTAEYLDPALLDGQAPDVASDLYALGVTLYEAAVGVPPYAGATPERIFAAADRGVYVPLERHVAVPEPLAALVGVLFARDPAVRPTSAAEVAARFDELERRLRREAEPTSPPPGGRAGVLGALPDGPRTSEPPRPGSGAGSAVSSPSADPTAPSSASTGTPSAPRDDSDPERRPPVTGDHGRSGTVRWGQAPTAPEPSPDPEPAAPTDRPPHRRAGWLVAGGVVLLAVVAGLVTVVLRSGEPAPGGDGEPDPELASLLATTEPRDPDPLCAEATADDDPLLADIDGVGCTLPVEWDGRTLEVAQADGGTARYELGADPDDVLLFGDWTCDGRDAPALYRPGDGQVFTFDALTDEAPVTVTGEPSGVLDGRPEVRTDADGCDVLLVRPAS